ncbi:unnamed protein product [Prorocentrum cordatum]|uniref:Subtilisin n=1 Tax=Prorocentrum cordatum TaxID=2364126 RepID=A0ABN9QSR5_9DINO|nr:unnamed protein product [Polarella glacialis]
MVVLSVVMSSVCLPLDELSGQLLDDIMPALDLTTTGDDLDMMRDMIDGCFSQLNDEDAILMEILFTRENGTKVNMSAKIKGQSTDLMKAKFATLDEKLATGAKMMEDQNLLDLLSLIEDNPADALIIGPADLSVSDVQNALPSAYVNLVGDPRTPDSTSVKVGAFSSLACDNHTFAGTVFYGLETLKTNMMFGDSAAVVTATSPATSCTGQVDCSSVSWPSECGSALSAERIACEAACAAANDLMTLKASIVDANTYRCDIFQDDADGNPCDVLNMAGDATNGYTNDCLLGGASSVTRLAVTCTLAEYTTYVRQWEQRLANVFTRVDDVLDAKQGQISVNLKDLVDEYITTPVESIVEGSSCKFLKTAYGDLITGLCFKGAMGFRYPIAAVLLLERRADRRAHPADVRDLAALGGQPEQEAARKAEQAGTAGDAWAASEAT